MNDIELLRRENEELRRVLQEIRTGIAGDRCDGESAFAVGVNAACKNHLQFVDGVMRRIGAGGTPTAANAGSRVLMDIWNEGAAMQLALDALDVSTTPLPEDRQTVLRAKDALRRALKIDTATDTAAAGQEPAQCHGPAERLSQLREWLAETGALPRGSSWIAELEAIVAGRGEKSDEPASSGAVHQVNAALREGKAWWEAHKANHDISSITELELRGLATAAHFAGVQWANDGAWWDNTPIAANAGGLLDMLANHGGAIVRTASLDAAQIAAARVEKRMYVREDGCGFAHLPDPAKHIAEVTSKYGDPEDFGERELVFDADTIQRLPYGTKLYAVVPRPTATSAGDQKGGAA